jgi:hypothetical protein
LLDQQIALKTGKTNQEDLELESQIEIFLMYKLDNNVFEENFLFLNHFDEMKLKKLELLYNENKIINNKSLFD